MSTKITDLPEADYTALIDDMARAMAEADGALYWKFDDEDRRTDSEIHYRRLARRHLAAHRVMFSLFRGWPPAGA